MPIRADLLPLTKQYIAAEFGTTLKQYEVKAQGTLSRMIVRNDLIWVCGTGRRNTPGGDLPSIKALCDVGGGKQNGAIESGASLNSIS